MSFVGVGQNCVCPSFPFGTEGGMWDVMALIPDHCLSIYFCHGLLKNSHAPAEDRTGGPSIYSLALYHVAIKAGLYSKAVQVYDIPNLYPVTFSPSILNSSSNSQEYKNHRK